MKTFKIERPDIAMQMPLRRSMCTSLNINSIAL